MIPSFSRLFSYCHPAIIPMHAWPCDECHLTVGGSEDTEYSFFYCTRHALGPGKVPAEMDNTEIEASSLIFRTKQEPIVAEVPWDKLTLSMKEVEVLAAVKVSRR